jgi:hypothetical protein
MDVLDLHQRRRERGIPTLTVLTGPLGLGVARWRRWAAERGVVTAGPEPLVGAWLQAQPGLRERAAHVMAAAARASASELLARATAHDVRQLPVNHELAASPAGRLAVALLAREDPASLPPLQRWAGAAALAQSPPAVLWVEQPGEDWLAVTLRSAMPLIEAAPAVPFALAMSARTAAALAHSPPTREVTLAREGRVEISRCSAERLAERVPTASPSTAAQLLQDGVDEPLVERFSEALQAVRDHDSTEGKARSAAEQFLFDRLASLPETAGLFELNVPLDFSHGPAPAQADLFARSLRLVIEVDGSYFHLNPEQYRRDRRKDWLLQQHGYPTLRFLAEDVVERLDEVLEVIRAAVYKLTPARGQR